MLFLSIALPIILIGLMLVGMVMVIEKHEKNVLEEEPRNVILPGSLTQEDFDWFCWSMEMAGLDKKRVINTCSCGYAEECYMHCNHELNDGKCTGHAWKSLHAPSTTGVPWSGKFQATQKTIETQHRQRSVSDQKIADFKAKMIANRNAKLKAEFEAGKEIVVKAPVQSPSLMQWNPQDDTCTVYGKKISRMMLEDLIYNGGLTRDQLREILAPNYGTLEEVHEFGRREPIAYIESPPDVSWIKMERVSK